MCAKRSNRNHASKHAVPRIRLAVWYFNEIGRSGTLNNHFYHHLFQFDLRGWEPENVQPIRNQVDIRGDFVPIEVDLVSKQSDANSPPYETLREIFHQVLPNQIEGFLRAKNKTAHHIVVYPLGNKLSEQDRQAYTFFHAKHSLAMDYTGSALSQAVNIGPMESSIESLIKSIPGAILEAKKLSPIIKELVSVMAEKNSPADVLPLALDIFSNLELPADLLSEMDHQRQGPTHLVTQEIKTSWGRIVCSNAVLRQLSRHLGDGAKKLQAKNGELNSSELYYMLTKAKVATHLFSIHREEVESLRNMVVAECEKHQTSKQKSQNVKMSFSVIFFVIGLVSTATIGPLWMAGAGLAGIFAYGDHKSINDLVKKGEDANLFSDDLGTVALALRDAQVALAVKFCTQILNLSPELMTLEEQDGILTHLGLDVSELDNDWYNRELINVRLQRYSDTFDASEKLRSKLAKSFGLIDVRKAT